MTHAIQHIIRKTLFLSLCFSISIIAQGQLSGTYTIDPSGSGSTNFTSFKKATDSLNAVGVNGPVIFKIAPNVYKEQVIIKKINGASSKNTITFDGQDSAKVMITYAGTSNTNAHTILIDNATFITLKNMTIENTGSNEGIGILVYKDASDITIRNNLIINTGNAVKSTNTGYKCIEMNGGLEADNRYYSGTAAIFKNIIIDSNQIVNAAYGIHSYGTTGSSSNTSSGIVVSNNIFKNIYDVGMSFNRTNGVSVLNNEVRMRSTTGYGVGVYFYNAHAYNNNANIIENNILDVRNTGIHFATSSNYGKAIGRIANNMIFGFTSSAATGIYATYPRQYEVYHNSIEIAVPTSNYDDACIDFVGGSDVKVFNNNLVYSASSGQGLAFYVDDVSAIDSMDYNNFYNAASFYLIALGGPIPDFKFKGAQGLNEHSLNEDPVFTSSTDLTPKNICLSGKVIPGLNEDIFGNKRSTPPSMGAAEPQSGLSLDMAATNITKPSFPVSSGSQDIYVVVANKGTNTITSADVIADVNGTTKTINWTGSLKPCSSDTVKFTGKNQFSLKSGVNKIKAYISNPNSSSDLNASNDTAYLDACTPMAGTFTVDPNGTSSNNFKTLTEAVDALNCGGVSGKVTFQIAAGSYSAQASLIFINGVSSTNTISFIGAGRNSTTVSLPSNAPINVNFSITGTPYVTIKDMKLVNSSSSYGANIQLTAQSDYCVIQNCDLEFTTLGGTYNTHIAIASSLTGNSGNDEASHTLVDNNAMIKGYYGIKLIGSASHRPYDNKFTNNTMTDIRYYAVYENYSDSTLYQNNVIDMDSTYLYNYGFYSYQAYRTYILQNRIFNAARYGMYIYFNNQGTSYKSEIINNMVGGGFGNYAYGNYGLYHYYSDNAKIYHNTIFFDDQSSANGSYYPAAFYLRYSDNNDIQNNIFIYSGSNSQGTSIYEANTSGNTFDHNVIYSTSIYWTDGSSTYYTLGDYLANSSDNQNSYDGLPDLVSTKDLHLAQGSQLFTGKDVGVLVDIDGDKRCSYKTIIGADEGNTISSPPNATFIRPDSIFVKSPVSFVAVPKPGTEEGYKWYLNGKLQTTTDSFNHTFTSAGSDTVILAATNCGGTDRDTFIFNVLVPKSVPVIDFIADKYLVSAFDTVQLTDLSDNGPTSWLWDISPSNYIFVNGFNAQNAKVVFTDPGIYEVCLTASNSVGSSSKVCKKAFIEVRESVDMCVDASSNATSGILYDDLGASDGYSPNVNCSFLIEPCASDIEINLLKFNLASGDFLRIYDGADKYGKPLWDVKTYGANGLTGDISDPGIDSTFKASSGRVYVEFQTNAAGTGKGFALAWESTHTPGSFTQPVASFDVADTVCRGVEVAFENTSTGKYNKYEWYDGQNLFPFKGTVYSKTFSQSGTYDIELKAITCVGRDSVKKSIVVIDPTTKPTAYFYANNQKPLVNKEVVSLYDTTSTCADKFKWIFEPKTVDFVNGTNDESRYPQVIFKETKCYKVTFLAGNSLGYDTLEKTCYIQPYGYCTPKVATLNSDVGIGRFIFAGIDNSSSIGLIGYTDYSSSISTEITKGKKYPLTLERKTGLNQMVSKVWIDYNRDGDFGDAGELIASNGPGNKTSWSDTIQIPTSASSGPTILRVGTGLKGDKNDYCGPNSYGEYEDYKVVIVPDKDQPVLSLIGNDTLHLEACYSLSQLNLGAKAIDNADGDISAKVNMTHNIDTAQPGVYMVVYKVSDAAGNEADSVIQYVIVDTDMTPPNIALMGNAIDTLIIYDSYTDPMVTTSDNCSGVSKVNVTNNVDSSIIGEYQIVYTAFDNAGNASPTIYRTVRVIDTTKPSVSLAGGDTIALDVNHTFIMPSFNVHDNYQKGGFTVDTAGTFYQQFPSGYADQLGVFTITYTFTDASGNATSYDIWVNVVDRIAPEISFPGNVVLVNINEGETADENLYMVSDNYADSADLVVTITGSYFSDYLVNMKPGIYEMKYSAEDPSGNVSNPETKVVVVNDLVGISEINNALKLKIYPNPTKGILTLEVHLKNEMQADISIIDVSGKTLKTINNSKIKNATYTTDLSGLTGGLYFVKIVTNDYVKLEKVILTR